jgi:hypothetical protein
VCAATHEHSPRLWRHRWMSVVTSESRKPRAASRLALRCRRCASAGPPPSSLLFFHRFVITCHHRRVACIPTGDPSKRARALSLHAVRSVRLPHSSFFIRWAAVFCRTASLQRGTDSSSGAQLHSLCLSRRSVRCASSAFARASVASVASVDGLSLCHSWNASTRLLFTLTLTHVNH